MQTYYSALPLMPSESLLSKKYSAISRPSLKLSESSYPRIINHPQVILPKFLDCSTSFDDIIALSLWEDGIAFFNTRTGNEFGSGIPTADGWGHLLAFSPDGKWIATKIHRHRALELWNVETRTRVKAIEIEPIHSFERITYSADGGKVIFVTWNYKGNRLVFIWDVKTDKPLKRLEVQAGDVAISPDGSQIAIHDELGIKIIDVSTGRIDRQITPSNDGLWTSDDPDPRIAWSPNGQFLASATSKRSETKLYLMSLTPGSAQVPILTRLECPPTKYVDQLAFSPDSSKVVALLWDNKTERTTLSIWCTQSGALVGTSSGMTIEYAKLYFPADGQDILICDRGLSNTPPNPTLHRFSVVPTHLETYMNDPPKFHPSQTPHTVQYSHHISGAIDDYDASHVAASGWILNTKGEREIWTSWGKLYTFVSCKPPQKGRTQYSGTLEAKNPRTTTVVLIDVIAFEQEDVSNGFC